MCRSAAIRLVVVQRLTHAHQHNIGGVGGDRDLVELAKADWRFQQASDFV